MYVCAYIYSKFYHRLNTKLDSINLLNIVDTPTNSSVLYDTFLVETTGYVII